MATGAVKQRIVEDGEVGCCGGQTAGDGAAVKGKGIRFGKAILREKAIGSGPVLKLGSGSGEQAGHGMASETEKRTQREGLRAVGDAALVEGREAFVPELLELGEDAGEVFFKAEGGGTRRRNASSDLSSTSHSTASPREKSLA